MFTGIVTDIGEVVALAETRQGRRVSIACAYQREGIAIGASIACGGPCLTVVETAPLPDGRTAFTVEAAAETLSRTTAGAWRVGTRLNLERSLKLGDELGGHIVTGHVDGLARVLAREAVGEAARLTLEVPARLARFIAEKGSVALDGTSLTVNAVEGTRFSVMLIPHTLAVTTWGGIAVGDAVNVEVDLMARYAARLAESSALEPA